MDIQASHEYVILRETIEFQTAKDYFVQIDDKTYLTQISNNANVRLSQQN